MARSSELVPLKAGSPAVAVCALKNPFGVVHVQITPVEMGTDAVAVHVRIQHVPLPTSAEIPPARETAWSPESAPVIVPYHGSAGVQGNGHGGKKGEVLLVPA